MSIAQQHEADLLRDQLGTCRRAAEIQIADARKDRDRALNAEAAAHVRFIRCIGFAAAGWIAFSVLAVTCALHYGVYHSSSSTGAAGASSAAPLFHGGTK